MISFVGILILGFFLGMRHATDPDHVIAVATIVTRQRGVAKAGVIGALWGMGHTLTIFLVGAAIILFKVAIPPRLGLSMEFAVGLMLILLGVLNLTGVLHWLQHRFTPSMLAISVADEPASEVAPVPPAGNWLESARAARPAASGISETMPVRPGRALFLESARAATRGDSGIGNGNPSRVARPGRALYLESHLRDMGLYNVLRPLVVGTVHGLAGSAAVAILVMTTITDPWWAIAYLLLFGLGTIAGMAAMTTAMAFPIAYTGRKMFRWNQALAVGSGVLSVAFGMFISFQIGIGGGLFTGSPHWTPR